MEMEPVAHAQAKGQTFHIKQPSECKSKLVLQKNLQWPHVVAHQDSKKPVSTEGLLQYLSIKPALRTPMLFSLFLSNQNIVREHIV